LLIIDATKQYRLVVYLRRLYVKLVERLNELTREFEENRERIREIERRQIVVEAQIGAFKMMYRDLLSNSIEDTEL